MALTHSSSSVLGSLLPAFRLPGVDGKHWSPEDFGDQKALVVIFMCNHCPYVIAVQDRINALHREFAPRGVALIGINSNDSKRYPADSFEAMQQRAREKNFGFPYLLDETQAVARAFDAVCTPDPYVYEKTPEGFVLRYRGRIDDSWKDEALVQRRDLANALEAILQGRPVDPQQTPSMGCSIKWKPASA
jgi:peroxiredoxin